MLHIYADRASVDAELGQTEGVFDSYKDRAAYMYHKTAIDVSALVALLMVAPGSDQAGGGK
jgi:hypothetical protein